MTNIAPGLEALKVPIGELVNLPGNPRQGDVDLVAASYRDLGQRKPIVYQTRDGEKVVIAGNHQLMAARDVLGWDEIAAVSADDLTEDQAQAFAVLDNSIHDAGTYDDELMSAFVDTIEMSWTEDESLSALLAGLDEPTGPDEEKYTRSIQAPVYHPSSPEPPLVAQLSDSSRTVELLAAIDAADLDGDLECFLRSAAERHTMFRFGAIAEFYAHAPAEVQRLMEDSGLVIIDFDQAVELGFVAMTQGIAEQFPIDDEAP